MKPDKELANDLILAMVTYELENALLKVAISKQLEGKFVAQIEKAIANAKTDHGMVQGAFQAIAALHAELPDADDPEQLAKRYVEMHLHVQPSEDAN
ncbi:MAG TPA: hypothetical protein VFF64_04180 [Candidatus Eremiobacteraceae bacterium]|nr:hypothetical protein [Candidatus Eremiobacteraceae bacterium]